MKKTIFYDDIKKMNAFMAEFNGWEMPIYVTSIKDEHFAVRNNVGVFDASHMAFFSVKGGNALDFLNRLVPTDLTNKNCFKAIYSVFCNENAGILDDIIIYKRTETEFFVVANAGNEIKIFDWLNKNNTLNVKIELKSRIILALQGPKCLEIMQQLFEPTEFEIIKNLKYFEFSEINPDTLVARTGYTGEIGFEIVLSHSSSRIFQIWTKMQDLGVKICGLGARDSLRLEAGYPLYGHELNEEISPLEAGLDFIIDLEKSDFIGKKSLLAQKINGISKKIIALEINDKKFIPRQGNEIFADDQKIGVVTSGTYSFFLNKTIAFGLIDSKCSTLGREIEVLIRGNKTPAKIVKKHFYYNPDIKF